MLFVGPVLPMEGYMGWNKNSFQMNRGQTVPVYSMQVHMATGWVLLNQSHLWLPTWMVLICTNVTPTGFTTFRHLLTSDITYYIQPVGSYLQSGVLNSTASPSGNHHHPSHRILRLYIMHYRMAKDSPSYVQSCSQCTRTVYQHVVTGAITLLSGGS